MPEKDYKNKIIKWAVNNPGRLWDDTKGAAAARKWLRLNAPDDFKSLYYNEPDDIRKKIDRRFVPNGVSEEEMQEKVRSGINRAGEKIYNIADAVTGFIPGPVGAVNWLGHMGANAASGKWGEVVGDLAMAGIVGAGAKVAGRALSSAKRAFRLGDDVLNLDEYGSKLADSFNYEPRHTGYVATSSPASSGVVGVLPEPSSLYGNLRFIRNINGLPYVSPDGGVTLAPQTNIFGNFTTDLPFRLHTHYSSMPGGEIMLIDPVALRGKRPWNTDVMDTFFRASDLTGIDPKHITLLSGNENYLNEAQKLGMKVGTNQELINAYADVAERLKTGRIGSSTNGWDGSYLAMLKDYRQQMDNLVTSYGRPSYDDYRMLDSVTGLRSGVSPDVTYGVNDLTAAVEATKPGSKIARDPRGWIAFPDGRKFDYYEFRKLAVPYAEDAIPSYKNVYYNPFPTAESELMQKVGGHGHHQYDPSYDDALQYLFDNYVNSNTIKKYGGKIRVKQKGQKPLSAMAELSPIIMTPDKDYSIFLNSLPDNQRFTPESEYSTRRYWELNGRPKNFEEAKNLGMYNLDSSDGLYHANSVAWGEDGIGYFMKPKHHDTIKYELDWYKNGLITEEGGKQRQMNKNERAEWEDFRRLYDLDTSENFFKYVPKSYASGGNIHIKPSHRGRLTELKARTDKTEAELYNDGNPAHKKMVVFARNARKWHADGGFLTVPEKTEYANKWDSISNARYGMANGALIRSGSNAQDSDRLARILAAQSALEAGWVDTVKGNNFAGYMSNGKRMSFDTADDFWDYHIKNLDERWPDWRKAQTVEDYYNTVNNTALGLTTKELFQEYNKNHRDNPAYIYAPDWENENYLKKLQSIYDKYISTYVKPMFDAGGFIQKYGKDKILSVLKKLKQPN